MHSISIMHLFSVHIWTSHLIVLKINYLGQEKTLGFKKDVLSHKNSCYEKNVLLDKKHFVFQAVLFTTFFPSKIDRVAATVFVHTGVS